MIFGGLDAMYVSGIVNGKITLPWAILYIKMWTFKMEQFVQNSFEY